MSTVSCRLPPAMGQTIDEVVANRELYRSEVLRAALWHYIETNPDGYAAFETVRQSSLQSADDGADEPPPKSANSMGERSIYDPSSTEW